MAYHNFHFFSIPAFITLRNPWGFDGAGNDANPSDGYVTITADEFFGYFTGAVGAKV
jgi:hypothetical protein